MKVASAIAIVLSVSAPMLSAAVITDPAGGALRLTLIYDASGNAWITKNTLYDSGALDTFGYEMWSNRSRLDPAGWNSLADQHIDGFMEMQATASACWEATFGSYILQPDVLVSLGKPILAGTALGDLWDSRYGHPGFYYAITGHEGNKFLGLIVTEPPIPGDANRDGLVDSQDFTTLKANFGQSPKAWREGNFNEDTLVDSQDFTLLKAHFGDGVPPGSVPEPATLSLLGLLAVSLPKRGAPAMARSRKRRVRGCGFQATAWAAGR